MEQRRERARQRREGFTSQTGRLTTGEEEGREPLAWAPKGGVGSAPWQDVQCRAVFGLR